MGWNRPWRQVPRRLVRGPSGGPRAARRGGAGDRWRSTLFSASSCCRWGPGDLRAICSPGARTQHTTLLAPEFESRRHAVRAARHAAVPIRFHRCDSAAAHARAGRGPLRGAARGRARAHRRRLPDDLRLQPLQRLGRAARVRPLLRPARHFRRDTRRMLSERRLRDWVALLGFDVDSVHGYLGFLPLEGRAPRTCTAGGRSTAGAYLLKARKRVSTLTLIGRGGGCASGYWWAPRNRPTKCGHDRSRDLHRRRLPRQSGSRRLGGAAGFRQRAQGGVGSRSRQPPTIAWSSPRPSAAWVP